MFEDLKTNLKQKLMDKKIAMTKSFNKRVQVYNKINEQLKDLHQVWIKNSENEKSFFELPFQKILHEKYNEQNQIKLMKYLSRVRESAGTKILEDESFANQFLNNEEFSAVILSADIRRSTELMLKCQTPQIYAEFLNVLTSELSDCVKNRYGIYDKFTGDGLLAFFPDFYSGKKAVLHSLQCAYDCQKIFDTIFLNYKKHFDIGDMETGIGVGIDSGTVFKAGEDLEYTVVGKPVVYACRFSASPAGHTYLTERAYRLIDKSDLSSLKIKKTTIAIKHEPDSPAYDIKPVSDISFSKQIFEKPDWAIKS